MEAGTVNLEAGKLLANRYRIEKVLGQGGMGAVYLAHDRSLGDKAVAVKEMRVASGDAGAHQAALAQFRQEAQFLANLEHPNLVQVSDFFIEEERNYLVMAYVKGQNLGEMLKARRGAFPVAKVVEWGRQLAAVLNYLHTQQPPILFRDLKPSNVMLDGSDNVRLIDFGIARSFHPEGVTATFLQGMGSAGYSPLEQYQGAGGTDPRSDIYALGATLYHLLTNQLPLSPVELVSENKPMPSARRWNPTLPHALDQILLKMLAVRKDDRYQSMDQVQALLEVAARNLQQEEGATESLGSAPSLPPPVSAPLAQVPTLVVRAAPPTNMLEPDPNSGLLYATIGVLTVAALGLFAYLFSQANQVTPPRSPAPITATSSAPPSLAASRQPGRKESDELSRSRRLPVGQRTPSRPQPPLPPRPAATAAKIPRPQQQPRVPGSGYPEVPVAAPRPKIAPVPAEDPSTSAPSTPQPTSDPVSNPVANPAPAASQAVTPPTTTLKPGGKRFSFCPGWVWYGRDKGGWQWEWPGMQQPPFPPPEPDERGQMPQGRPTPQSGVPGY